MIAQNVNINAFVSVAWKLLVNRFCFNKRIPPVRYTHPPPLKKPSGTGYTVSLLVDSLKQNPSQWPDARTAL
jgi:hypothetical protein